MTSYQFKAMSTESQNLLDNNNITEPLAQRRSQKVSFDISGPTFLAKSQQLFRKNTINNNPSLKQNPDIVNFECKTERPVRWFVMILAVVVIMGTEFCYYNPMPVEEEVIEQLRIDGSAFNFLFTVYSLPNIFAPLFAGLLVGKLGPRLVMLIFLSISLSGQVINSIAIYTQSYTVMIFGRIFLGIGSECVQVAQSTIVSMWFGNAELSLAMGISLAFPMLGGSFNNFITPIISEGSPLYVCFVAGFVMLLLSMGACIMMVIIDKRQQIAEKKFNRALKEQEKQNSEIATGTSLDKEEEEEIEAETIDFSLIKQITGMSWLVLILSGLSVGLIMPFMDSANGFAKSRYHLSDKATGVATALPDAISAISTPFLGILVDKVPKQRTKFLLVSFLVFLVGHVSAGLITCDSACWTGYIPFVLLGIAFTSWYSIVMPTIPLAVEEKLLGTCFGLSSICQHTTISIYVTITGLIKNAYEGSEEEKFIGYGYQNLFFICSGVLCFVLSSFIYFYEKKNKPLEKSTRSRSIRKSSLMPDPNLLKNLSYEQQEEIIQEIEEQQNQYD